MDDARERLSEFDRALADALDVDVSPGFAARVRRRIELEPELVPVWQAWRIALPIAAAAVIVVIGMAAVLLTRAPAAPQTLIARTLRLELLRPAEEQRVAAPALRTVAASRPAPRVETTVAAAEPEGPAEPLVLVPREEIEMYRRLFAAAQAVKGPALVEVWTNVPVAELSISAIQIDPIRIDLIAPPVSGEGDRR